ncbi:hypothetical protein PG996_013844 [Apiospora saccharicola]|uniref:TLC domain-containing protein n=1 Tax=Apiospora saccharicola TaxID=335842 RepID=A0ABR1TGM0_9PEZI
MELVMGADDAAQVIIPVSELGNGVLPPAWQLGIDMDAVYRAQNDSIASHSAALNGSEYGMVDVNAAKIARMDREAVAPGLLPYAPLLLAVFCIAYMYFDKLLHSKILPRIYGNLFTSQDLSQRQTFALHHNAILAFGLTLLFGVGPLLRVVAGEGAYSDPLFSGSPLTLGGCILVPAIGYCATYLGEMFIRRDQPGMIPKLHHISVLLVALSTIGITGDVEHNRSATVSFYIISVWCLFDIVTELPVHAGMVAWRCARNHASARTLSNVMLYLALWRLSMLLANLGVSVYLIYSAWRKLSTIWCVLAPMAGWVWFYAQLQSAHVLYGISRRVSREWRVAATEGGSGGDSKEAAEDGLPPRSGMLFNDPAYAGLTLGTTLLSYTHASGASQGLLSNPNRTHLLVLAGVALVVGLAMLLVRYFTQDAEGVAGLAARADLAALDHKPTSNLVARGEGKHGDKLVARGEPKHGDKLMARGEGKHGDKLMARGEGKHGDKLMARGEPKHGDSLMARGVTAKQTDAITSRGVSGYGGVAERATEAGLVAAVAEALREVHHNTTTAAPTAEDAVGLPEEPAPAVLIGRDDGGDAQLDAAITSVTRRRIKRSAAAPSDEDEKGEMEPNGKKPNVDRVRRGGVSYPGEVNPLANTYK